MTGYFLSLSHDLLFAVRRLPSSMISHLCLETVLLCPLTAEPTVKADNPLLVHVSYNLE